MKYLIVILFPLASCITIVTEPERQLNHQNVQAAAAVEEGIKSGNLEMALGAARDIKANSATLLKTQGAPDNPRLYSPEASAQFRNDAVIAREQPPGFLGLIAQAAAPIAPWAIPALAVIWGLYRKINASREVIETLVEGGEEVKNLDPAKREAVEAKMKEVAIRNGNYKLVRAHVRAAKRAKAAGAMPTSPQATPPITPI